MPRQIRQQRHRLGNGDQAQLGKLNLQQPFPSFITQHLAGNSFVVLPIRHDHSFVVAGLPFHHRDPFDRMLIAQSLVEGMSVVSVDPQFDQYGVTRLW